jgi:putative transposase
VYFNIRLEEDRLACLVIVGVLPDGRKEVIALEDGYRESTESWASVLRDLKRRGMGAPVLAVGDGNLGFWAALRDVFPETREQRCWKHKIANVLDKLPKRLQARAKEQLHGIMYAPDRESALEEIDVFQKEYGPRYAKAVETLSKDQERMLTFFDFPAEHWLHLRTTNPIESTFATVKARTRKTKGAGSRKAGLAMAWKLLMAAQDRWRCVNAPHLTALVKAGVEFVDGEAEMLQCDPQPEELLMPTPWILAVDALPVHNI